MELFNSIIDTQSQISIGIFFLCMTFSLLCGIIFSIAFTIKNETSKSFKISLIILPIIVCVIIIMVNGNIGAGVAIAGAFSLVRFRSAPGSTKEICVLFGTMCAGLICGVGYVAYAICFTIFVSLIMIILNYYELTKSNKSCELTLKITIPEDLEYEDCFIDIFDKYTKYNKLLSVRTTNMGSMFKLTYLIKLVNNNTQKEFIDNIRMRNGNLEVSLLKCQYGENEL